MGRSDPVAGLLAAMIHDTCWANPWHRLHAAVEDLTDEGLDHRALRPVHSPRAILLHAAGCARAYAGGLAPPTDDPAERESDALVGRRARRAADVIGVVDAACRRLHARARTVTDAELCEPSGVWNGASKGFVLIGGGVLHAAWHFGQVAMLCQWRRAAETAPMISAPGPPGTLPPPRRREWPLGLGSRKAACLSALHAAYRECGWASLRRRVEGLSADELAWRPYETVWGPGIAIHVAHCKVIYADQAFGTAALRWEDCDRLLGAPGERPDGVRMAAILDRSQEFLLEHVAAATDEQIEHAHPMHHGVPHTGWQAACAMAQHDAWHAGQIALMRDVYRALSRGIAGPGSPRA